MGRMVVKMQCKGFLFEMPRTNNTLGSLAQTADRQRWKLKWKIFQLQRLILQVEAPNTNLMFNINSH